ncbi:MAG: maleylpyruvate isomerase N-terminal domain-containing protein [Acidimicrobiales bacterium]|jgi:uncharacterized protein (TIGR03083 family)
MKEAQQVRRVAEECAQFLAGVSGENWSRPIDGMTWTVAKAVAHEAGALLWYASDLSSGMPELSTMEAKIKVESEPADLIRTVVSNANLLACVMESSGSEARGYHPAGIADAAGFGAMGCDEMLIHTDDAAHGLRCEFSPPRDLAQETLRRLFPWAPDDVDPWLALKWANGRIELEGRDRLSKWSWHCAPLEEWDGTDPTAEV